MKWIAFLKILDIKVSESWSSGSAITIRSKPNCESKEEAEKWIEELRATRYNNDEKRYQFTTCVLSYDAEQSDNIEKFFKNMH